MQPKVTCKIFLLKTSELKSLPFMCKLLVGSSADAINSDPLRCRDLHVLVYFKL